jgi:hypothetical protein
MYDQLPIQHRGVADDVHIVAVDRYSQGPSSRVILRRHGSYGSFATPPAVDAARGHYLLDAASLRLKLQGVNAREL